MIAKTLERAGDRLENMDRKTSWDNQPQIKNLNLRKKNNTRKAKEAAPDQNIRPPFQENCAESSQNNV